MKELAHYLDRPFELLTTELPMGGYGVEVSHTASLRDIRKALTEQHPVFARVGSRTLLLSGTDGDGLVAYDGHGYSVLSEPDLRKAWTGETVVVTEKTDPQVSVEAIVPDSNIIYVEARDTWDADLEERKEKARATFALIEKLPPNMLPSHPVIVIFKKPTEKEREDHVRSHTLGAEITILDPSDPTSEFFHELGHVYWRTRLNAAEKQQFITIQKGFRKEALPGIFTDAWSWRDGEETFCTVYMWYLKGKLIHAGYLRILENQLESGCTALCNIMKRVHDAACVQKAWAESERKVAAWLSQVNGQPSKVVTTDGRLLKAKLPHMIEMIPVRVPDSLGMRELWVEEGARWVEPTEGLLKGRVLVLRGDRFDPELTKAVGNRAHLTAKKVNITRKGKTYQQTVWVRMQDSEQVQAVSKKTVEAARAADVPKETIRAAIQATQVPDIDKTAALVKLDQHYPVSLDTSSMPAGPAQKIDTAQVLKQYRPSGTPTSVKIDDIAPESRQIRTAFDKAELQELADSIHENGLLQPILVRPDPAREGKFLIVAGERRWRALNLLKQQNPTFEAEVPVVIRDLSDRDKDVLQLIENKVRVDNTPLELAAHYERLMVDHKMTQEAIAKQTGVSVSTIQNYVRLNRLDPTLKQMLANGDMSKEMADGLSRAPTHSDQVRLYNLALRKGWKGAQIKAYLKHIKEQPSFFSDAEIEGQVVQNARKELDKLGVKDPYIAQQKYKQFVGKQVEFIDKFIKDDLTLTALGAAVAGDLAGGISKIEEIQRQLAVVVERMKQKYHELNTSDMFMKASRWVQSIRMDRDWKALQRAHRELYT